jgi:tRNA pseudouridine55 synthase
MNGILVIDKPEGITSHDVVARVRRILKTKRVGHTGTLDPFATGVMVVVVGMATRLAQFLDKDEKEYEAVIRFGNETDTGDRTGRPAQREGVSEAETAARLQNIEWVEILDSFLGESEQTPPMYSAKKIDGKKLYEHARRGEVIERKPVRISIPKIEFIDRRTDEIKIRVACSAGTYIRVLGESIGRSVGLGSHLTELRRIRSGRFSISEALTLEDFAKMDTPGSALMPCEAAVGHLPKFIVPDNRVEKTRNGLSTRMEDLTVAMGEPIRMTSRDGDLIAIGIYDESENSILPKVVLI